VANDPAMQYDSYRTNGKPAVDVLDPVLSCPLFSVDSDSESLRRNFEDMKKYTISNRVDLGTIQPFRRRGTHPLLMLMTYLNTNISDMRRQKPGSFVRLRETRQEGDGGSCLVVASVKNSDACQGFVLLL